MAANRRGGQASGSEAEAAEVAEALDALYALPLDAFTEARDERAKELKKAGAKEAAASVKALRKPTVAAWALNQLARRDPARMEAFLRASEGMREAQKNALGPGGAQGLREAVREQRDRVSELLREASRILDEGGFSAKGAPLDSVRETLLAAPTATAEALEMLRKGLLTKDVEPGDVTDVLGLMAGIPREASKEEREPKPRPKPTTKHREEAEEELEEPPPKSETKPKAKRPKTREERLAEAKERREAREREAREREEARAAEERARREEKEREERERKRQAAIASARKAATEAQQVATRERQRAAELQEAAERAEAAAKEARERAEAAEQAAQEAEAHAEAAASELAELES